MVRKKSPWFLNISTRYVRRAGTKESEARKISLWFPDQEADVPPTASSNSAIHWKGNPLPEDESTDKWFGTAKYES